MLEFDQQNTLAGSALLFRTTEERTLRLHASLPATR